MVAQTIHASGESAAAWAIENQSTIPTNTFAIALMVANEAALCVVEQLLITNAIKHIAIREPDLNNQLMAIGLYPTTNKKTKQLLRSYKLLS